MNFLALPDFITAKTRKNLNFTPCHIITNKKVKLRKDFLGNLLQYLCLAGVAGLEPAGPLLESGRLTINEHPFMCKS